MRKGYGVTVLEERDDETPARELHADADVDATKGPTRALYMFSICLAGAVDLIHSRQLSRPSVHNCACVQAFCRELYEDAGA